MTMIEKNWDDPKWMFYFVKKESMNNTGSRRDELPLSFMEANVEFVQDVLKLIRDALEDYREIGEFYYRDARLEELHAGETFNYATLEDGATLNDIAIYIGNIGERMYRKYGADL